MKKFITLIILLIFSSALCAEQGYQLELLIFSHINRANYASEKWPAIDKVSFDINDQLAEITPLSPEQYTLKKEALRLSQHPGYQAILHLAWVESQQQLEKTSIVHLYGGRLFDNKGKVITTISDESIPYATNQNWEMNGTVAINLARYFDLKFELLFALPYQQIKSYPTKSAIDQRFSYVMLQQTRRTKSRELNYIDHPLYGILLMITPTEIETPHYDE